MTHIIKTGYTWSLNEIIDLVGDVEYSDVYVWAIDETGETAIEYPAER